MRLSFSIVILTFLLLLGVQVHAQIAIHSIDDLYRLADTTNAQLRVGNLQYNQAELTANAALGNILNPRIPVTGSLIDNSKLPVSFIPATVFGGPEGAFREVKFGQQYISSMTITPQFDLINVSRWQDVKSAQINEQLIKSDLNLTRKNVHEQLNSIYCNLLALQEQKLVVERFIQSSDSLMMLVRNKYEQGIARAQDLEDAQINSLQQRKNLNAITTSIENQKLALAILVGGKDLQLEETLTNSITASTATANGNAELRNLELKKAYAHQAWKSSVSEQLPVLSFTSSLAWQNNSNRTFLDNEARWINSNYIGLKLTWDFPTNVSKYTAARSKRLNEQMATINWEQMQVQNTLRNQQINNDYLKAQADYSFELNIAQLNTKSFNHTKEQYNQELLGLDKLILSQEKLLSSSLNLISARANVLYQIHKIQINNEN